MKYKRAVEDLTCEAAVEKCKTCILRGDRVFKLIKRHLMMCKKCVPSHFVFHLYESGRNERATRQRVELFMFLMSTFDLTPKAKGICKDYLIRCTSWDLKIKYSKVLSKKETGESILEEIRRHFGEPPSKLRWPTRSYSMKFERYDSRVRKCVPKENVQLPDNELENDNLFRIASILGPDYLKTRVSNVDELLKLLEIEMVMST